MSSEASLHFELHRHLMNAIDDGIEASGIQFGRAAPEYSINGGRADIVVFDENDSAVLVIEAKRGPGDSVTRDFDPYSPQVVQQAFGYAGALGAKYFATYNGARLVLYRTFEEGTPLLERKTRAYRVDDISQFAAELLEEVAGLESGIVEWDPHHQAFLKRLHAYHERLIETFEGSCKERNSVLHFEAEVEE
jgi:predicted type IV restriction endonuclease